MDWTLLIDSLEKDGEEKVLLEDQPRALRFAYLEQLTEGGIEWQPEWRQQQGLPALIRVPFVSRVVGAGASVD